MSSNDATFKFALGDEIRDRDTSVAGVVTHQVNSRQGAGYWVSYIDADGVARQEYIPEVNADAGI